MLFGSGGSALVYQVAWMRELRLVFGATTASVAAVLAIFMGGLGLGSAVLGRRADRSPNPLRMYGLLETAVAFSVAMTPILVSLVAKFYFSLGGQESLGLGWATVVRLLLALAVMGVPTFLMGGTLPAAVRSITAKGDVRRRALAVLYGVNTLGAVCGAFLATFFALEFLGTRATLWFGCAMNLLAGVLALAWSRRVPTIELAAEAGGEEVAAAGGSGNGFVYATAAVLGFTFFTLELVWYRMLAPILGGTTFTFGLILCIALLGIGVGGASYHRVFRYLRPSWSALALTCAAEAALAALPLALGDWPALFIGRWYAHSTSFFQVVSGWCVVMMIVVFPVALVSGLQFPLLVALLGQGRAAVSRQLGTAYAWNTVGAIAGSLVGGFGALPILTAPGTWRAVVLMLAALSTVIVLRNWPSVRRGAVGVAALLAFAIVAVLQPGPTAVWRHSGIGAGRGVVPPADAVNETKRWANEQRRSLLWQAEGIESSIGITAPDGLSFVVNGKNDGNALGDAGTQIGVAAIGAALHPAAKKGLVIGLGTGESAGWLASMPGIERVDVVELEPAIDEMARRSSELNQNALVHPKVRRIYNDGREHVFTSDEKYDVILSEPSNPYRAGVASLYTQEFYRAVRDRLTPDGIFVQWVQAYEVDAFTVDTVLTTARSEFGHVEIWQTIPSDLQLVCSQVPIAYSETELRERIAKPVLSEALWKAWNVNDLEGFLAHFLASQEFVDQLYGADIFPPNTDDRNFLEYGFAKTVGVSTGFSSAGIRLAAIQAGNHRPPLVGGTIDWDLVDKRQTEFNWLYEGDLVTSNKATPKQRIQDQGYDQFDRGDFRAALAMWSELPPEDLSNIDRLVRARAHAEFGEDECLKLLVPIEARYPTESAAIKTLYYWKRNDAPRAAASLMAVIELLSRDPWVIAPLVKPSIGLMTQIAKADASSRQPLFELLAQPLAGNRFEPQRKLTRLTIAEGLGQEAVVEALAALEPNPPWQGELLQLRAATYAIAKHPLAEKSQRDWEDFQRHTQ